jgi:hypothetical protein
MTFYQLAHLPENWNVDGACAPNARAIRNAKRLIKEVGAEPAFIYPSVEEGVWICFRDGNNGLHVECYNDGEIGYTALVGGHAVSCLDVKDSGADLPSFVGAVRTRLSAAAA